MTTEILARRLLLLATAAYQFLPPQRRANTFEAMDAFIASPSPLTFAQGSRALSTEQRLYRVERLRAAGSEHAFERGMETLTQHPAIEPVVTEALGAIPVDGNAGKRLEALATLLTVHHELSSRAEAAAQALRKHVKSLPQTKRPPADPKRKRVNVMGA